MHPKVKEAFEAFQKVIYDTELLSPEEFLDSVEEVIENLEGTRDDVSRSLDG